jgi:hypothetical protein
MKKITTLIAFFSLIVGGVNAQQHRLIPISLQKWSQKNATMYTPADKEEFEKGGSLPEPYQMVEGITNPTVIYAKTRMVAKKRSSLHVGQISEYLKKEITLEDYYANLHTMRITFDSTVKVNAWDALAPLEEGWLRHPAGTYDFICYVDPETGSIFPTNHPICLNATNKTSLLAVVNGVARVASSNEDESGEAPFDSEDAQPNAADAARKKAAELRKRKSPDTDKNPYEFETADGKMVFSPTIIVYGSEGSRSVAVNKGGTGSASPSEAGVVKTEVFENQLPPMQQASPQQVRYRQTCACGGMNGQHYQNCSTFNRGATNSCNGCGVATTTRTNNGPAIAGAVLSGLNLGYDILTDVFAPNGRFKQQPIPVNRTIYVNNPTPPNPGQGGGQDWGGVNTTGTTGTNSGADWGGVNQNGLTTTTSTGSTGTWGSATDFVQTGLNGTGSLSGTSTNGSATDWGGNR